MTAAPTDDKPEGPLLVDQLRFMARCFPDALGYVDLDSGSALTFREWDEQSNQAARWLRLCCGDARQYAIASSTAANGMSYPSAICSIVCGSSEFM